MSLINLPWAKREMQERGLKIAQLAQESGLSAATIRNVFRNGYARESTADKLRLVLGTNLGPLFSSNYPTIRYLEEAVRLGAPYVVIEGRYVFKVGIEHPEQGFIISSTFSKTLESSLAKAHKKKRELNGARDC